VDALPEDHLDITMSSKTFATRSQADALNPPYTTSTAEQASQMFFSNDLEDKKTVICPLQNFISDALTNNNPTLKNLSTSCTDVLLGGAQTARTSRFWFIVFNPATFVEAKGKKEEVIILTPYQDSKPMATPTIADFDFFDSPEKQLATFYSAHFANNDDKTSIRQSVHSCTTMLLFMFTNKPSVKGKTVCKILGAVTFMSFFSPANPLKIRDGGVFVSWAAVSKNKFDVATFGLTLSKNTIAKDTPLQRSGFGTLLFNVLWKFMEEAKHLPLKMYLQINLSEVRAMKFYNQRLGFRQVIQKDAMDNSPLPHQIRVAISNKMIIWANPLGRNPAEDCYLFVKASKPLLEAMEANLLPPITEFKVPEKDVKKAKAKKRTPKKPTAVLHVETDGDPASEKYIPICWAKMATMKYIETVDLCANLPFFNITWLERYPRYPSIALDPKKAFYHTGYSSYPLSSYKRNLSKLNSWIDDNVIEMWLSWIFCDEGSDFHDKVAAMPLISQIQVISSNSKKNVSAVEIAAMDSWMTGGRQRSNDGVNKAQAKQEWSRRWNRKIVIIIMNEDREHWVIFLFINLMAILMPHEKVFSGWMRIDPMCTTGRQDGKANWQNMKAVHIALKRDYHWFGSDESGNAEPNF